jgi:hypothetical protein
LEYQNFVHDAAGAWEESIHLGLLSPVNKFRKFNTGSSSFVHPSFKGFKPTNVLNPQEYKTIKNSGMNIDQIKHFLETHDVQGGTRLTEFEQHLNGPGLNNAQKFLAESEPANVTILSRYIGKLSEIPGFGILKELLGFAGKFLGPIAIYLDGKNFFADLDHFGMDDGKTKCEFISLLSGAGALLPIPVVQEVAGVLWGVI